MLRYIKNNFGPFFTGVFFTIFLILFVFVIFLYNENSSLRDKVDKLTDLDVKISTGDSQTSNRDNNVTVSDSQDYSNVPSSTYLLPKDVEEIRPSNKPNKNPEGSSTYKPYYKATDVEYMESRNLERGDKKITETAAYTYNDKGEVISVKGERTSPSGGSVSSSGTETFTVHKDVSVEAGEFIEHQSMYPDREYSNDRSKRSEVNYTSTGTSGERGISDEGGTFYVHKDSDVEAGEFIEHQSLQLKEYSNKRKDGSEENQIVTYTQYDSTTGVERKVTTGNELIYNPVKWKDIKINMTRFQIKKILGKPSVEISADDYAEFTYNYIEGEGKLYFNSDMLLERWVAPK